MVGCIFWDKGPFFFVRTFGGMIYLLITIGISIAVAKDLSLRRKIKRLSNIGLNQKVHVESNANLEANDK